MTMGGVGKTIAASAIAVLIAKKGFDVLLTTTDPAAHIQDFIEQLGELPAKLRVERIDPKVETPLKRYWNIKDKISPKKPKADSGRFKVTMHRRSCSLSRLL
jgi:anion-transporting  ArsA/GET3 family ATPase